MALIQPVEDGKIVDQKSSSQNSLTKGKGNGLDKDAFLQLLVAQMQYQDPLEPTSNTEYISQFATFSELEEMQNMSNNINMQRAQLLVGKEVFLTVTSKTGNTETVYGRVDYVTMEGDRILLSVDNKMYSLDDLDTVIDSEYWEAYNLAIDWSSDLAKLPLVDKITLAEEDAIKKLKETFDKMTDYQKTFIAKKSQELLQSYVDKIDELNGNKPPEDPKPDDPKPDDPKPDDPKPDDPKPDDPKP